jgi:hypothetical protein
MKPTFDSPSMLDSTEQTPNTEQASNKYRTKAEQRSNKDRTKSAAKSDMLRYCLCADRGSWAFLQ